MQAWPFAGRGPSRGVAVRGAWPFAGRGLLGFGGMVLHALRACPFAGRGSLRFAGMALIALRAWPLRGRGPYMAVVFHGLGLSGPYLDERGLRGLDLFMGKTCNGMAYVLKLKIQLF